MIRTNEVRPLYREVMREALKTAWHEPKLWVFALFAGILQTGGVYDVLLASFRETIAQLQSMPPSFFRTFGTSGGVQMWVHAWSVPGTWTNFGIGFAFAVVFFTLSIIAQGALVAGIDARARGERVIWKKTLAVGITHFLPVACLNLLTLGCIWVLNAFLYIPLVSVMRGAAVWNILLTLFTFLILCVVTVGFTAVHLFGLQFIIQKQLGFFRGVFQAWRLFLRSWVIVIEKAFVLLLIGMGILAAAVFVGLIASMPGFVAFIVFMAIGRFFFASIASAASEVVFFLVILVAAVFAVTFQYAAWSGVYVRLSEGGALSKWHRFTKWLHEEARLFHR